MNRVRGMFLAGVFNLLGVSLSERIKRLVFLASLTARMKNQTTFDNETLVKLNQVMALCSTEAAMNLPVHLSRAIWHDATIPQITATASAPKASSQERLQQLVSQLLDTAPDWLRYGTESRMREDLVRLLSHQETVFG